MIEFQDVSVVYAEGHAALSNVSLRIETGEFVCIAGPTGAGKSTLLKLICYEEAPTSGQVIVRGQNLSDLRPREVLRLRRRIGVISQDVGLAPNKTLFENVALPLCVLGIGPSAANEKVRAALEMVGLLERADAFPHQVSAGERQLAALARAVVHDPSILIADQPTRNLAPDISLRIEQILTQLNARGTTVIMAISDTEILPAVPPRVVVLEKGRVVRDEASPQTESLTPTSLDLKEPVARRARMPRSPLRVFVREAGRDIRCKGLVSLTTLLVVIFSMMALGGALAVLYRLHQIAGTLPLHFQITLFLPKDLPPAETLDVKDRIAALSGVAEVRLIAKEQAWAEMKQEEQAAGLDLADALDDENPLPDRLDIRVDNPYRLAAVADYMNKLGSNYTVRDERAALNQVLATLQLFNILGGAAAILLFLIIALVIRNTLRSTILARGHEIRIMQWVGAAPSFIRQPLMLEGLFYGALGGAAASGIVLSVVPHISAYAQQCLSPLVQTLPPFVGPEVVVGALVGIGLLAGLIGSTISIRRLVTQQ
jgi:cell division transport system ATP-binding protein